jgi:hypothetical protein
MRTDAKWVIVVYDALCSTSTFVINGVDADCDDFGTKQDESPSTAEPYSCGDMRFTPKPAIDAVLSKYSITLDEYNKIAEELREKLSFGSCGWCS